jgi:serine/threonine protein phosphatase 1
MKPVKRFALNERGRDLAVGDCHGNFSKLGAALDSVKFDPTVDRLFSVGDLGDRGPESDQALEWLEKPWFHAVAGNHEDMAIRFPNGGIDTRNYIANGGAWNVANTPDVSRQFADAFSGLPIAMEVDTTAGRVGIVHAECPFPSWRDFVAALEHPGISKSMRDTVIDAAQWSRERITAMSHESVADVRAVIVGHTPVERMTSLGNTIYIDTGAWIVRENRPFTILDLETLRPVEQRSVGLWDER